MKRQKLLLFLILLLSLCPAAMISAKAKKTVDVPIDKNYEACLFRIETDKEGKYNAAVTDEEGNSYKCTQTNSTQLQATINQVTAGTWKVKVISDDDTELGKIKVSVSATTPSKTEVVDKINVGKDITGFQYYLENDSLVMNWENTNLGDISIKVTDLESSAVLCDERIHDTSYTCQIPPETKTLSVRVVPTSSNHVAGAEKLYTVVVNNHPDGTVNFPSASLINTDILDVEIILNKPYAVFAKVNGEPVSKPVDYEAGTSSISVPVPYDGENAVSVFLVDKNGNRRSFDATYEKDTIAPELSLNKEYDQAATKESTFVIEGHVSDYDTLQVNEDIIEASTDGYFSYECNLHVGENLITVQAKDTAGNDTTINLRIHHIASKNPSMSPAKMGILFVAAILFLLVGKKILAPQKKKSAPLSSLINNGNVEKKEMRILKKKDTDIKDINDVKEHDIKHKYIPVKNSKVAQFVKDNLGYIIIFAATMLFFRTILAITPVPTRSMMPKIIPSDIVISNRLAYKLEPPERGDVVIFNNKELKQIYCKRIIGLPGEEIAFQNGYVYINGERLREEYLDAAIETNAIGTYTVPENCYFMLGDNRENSYDSRFWLNPYIEKEALIAKELFVIPTHAFANLFSK